MRYINTYLEYFRYGFWDHTFHTVFWKKQLPAAPFALQAAAALIIVCNLMPLVYRKAAAGEEPFGITPNNSPLFRSVFAPPQKNKSTASTQTNENPSNEATKTSQAKTA